MGHVRTNVGGVYYDPKTADQPGMVYTHVPKATQQAALAFLSRELFKTPAWCSMRTSCAGSSPPAL
jgi:hypothetical protein